MKSGSGTLLVVIVNCFGATGMHKIPIAYCHVSSEDGDNYSMFFKFIENWLGFRFYASGAFVCDHGKAVKSGIESLRLSAEDTQVNTINCIHHRTVRSCFMHAIRIFGVYGNQLEAIHL